MNNLNFYLGQARKSHFAIGHFNFASEDVLKAIVAGAKEAGLGVGSLGGALARPGNSVAPCVMVGTSEGEADFVGIKEAVALVRAVADDMQFPVFLNADHFKSFEKCKMAIDAGYDSIIADGSKLPMADNIAFTKQVVDYARSVNPNISVEGELGYLKGSSEVQTKIEISPADYSKPEEVADFVAQTGVDRMAVVFGNIHGIVTGQEERLDIPHFASIVAAAPQPYYILHGASGLKDENIAAAIKAGITNVHFNTELRVAYHDKLKEEMTTMPNETTPYKYLAPAAEEVKKLVIAKTKLFMMK
jgi:fructose-bisphosphate aldolase class II